MIAAIALSPAFLGCGGGGTSCEEYARVTCEKACACTPDVPQCYLFWGREYVFESRAACEVTMNDICTSEDAFDHESCTEMVAATECSGNLLLHPMCEIEGDGRADAAAPLCSNDDACSDDALEPNDDPAEAVAIEPGSHALAICPCSTDWFTLSVEPGGTIDVTATFDIGLVDMDLKLYRPDDDGDVNPQAPPEASSTGTTDTEVIEYTSSDGGTYYLHAYAYPENGERAGSYELVVD